MFARKYRYSFKSSIPGKAIHTPYFVMRYDFDSKALQCGVVVGKKVDKSAVERNRIKRMILLQIKELLPSSSTTRIVLYAKKQVKDLKNEILKEELEKVFKSAKII